MARANELRRNNESNGDQGYRFAHAREFPSAVLAERFPDVPNVGDVTKVNWKTARQVWLC